MEIVHQDAILGSKEQALIAKGKRTKRQRLHSPIPFALSANSSSGDVVDDECNFVAENNHRFVKPDRNATEEEEDMANCLILLAQGRPAAYCSLPQEHVDTARFHDHHNNRRVLLTENVVAVERGCYGYECKTCYRTFPSFQALGGHRASHKKPKAMELAEKKMFLSSDEEEIQLKNNNVSHSFTLQLNQRGSNNLYSNNGKAKVHECAVCGAEFASGQALGGHMRRHRALPVGANTALSLTPTAVEPEADQRPLKRQKSVLSLNLDLNLPAPQEHDHQRESNSLIKSNQQQQQPQQPIVFPARTLVHCHY